MLQHVPAPIGRALSHVRAGQAALAVNRPAFADLPALIKVSSPEFGPDASLSARHTADGEGRSPSLSWRADMPAVSVVLIVEDADSPSRQPIVHAIAWKLPPAGSLDPSDLHRHGPIAVGTNTYGRLGWLPPDPPTGHGPHAYVFQLFALDQELHFPEPPGRTALIEAMQGHVVATGRLTGTYERPVSSGGWLPLLAGAGAIALTLAVMARQRSRTTGEHA